MPQNKATITAEADRRARSFLPGVTALSLSTIILGLIVIGFMIQVGNVHADASFLIGGLFALPLRPVMFVVPLILISGLVFYLTKKSLYSRAEMICVLAALLMVPPIMTEGFWSLAVGGMITIPQSSDMVKLDGYSDKMWPHGANILEGVLDYEDARQDQLAVQGSLSWKKFQVDSGKHVATPLLKNETPDTTAAIRIPLPLFQQDKQYLLLDEPYLLTVLARAENLEAESYYYCRIFYDDTEQFATEVFASRETAQPGYLRPGGFIRKGAYGVKFEAAVNQIAYIELGLVGRGNVAFADLKLMSVSVIEELFDGRKVVSQAEYDALPAKLRGRVLVKPASMFSLAGLKMILGGGIPLREWTNPAIFWLGYIVLLLSGTFAVAVIMRKQWLENERFPMPVAQIPIRLLGLNTTDEEELASGKLPAIWLNRLMWAGFGVSFFWCVMKIWAAYNSSVPNMSINVPLGPYFSDPSWGGMWNISFKVCSIFLAIGIFMELNILGTIVLGFFLYRAQLWFGHANGLTSVAGYPFQGDQMNGSYLFYALLVIFFTRKYLWRVVKRAVQGGRLPGEEEEVLSYRSAMITLLLCFAGVAVWAHWAGVGVAGMLVFYMVMLLVAFVAAKLRAECGVPFSTYFPWAIFMLVPLFGGAPLVIPAGFLFLAMISELFGIRSFMLVPGIQLEMIELGRRARVVPRHMLYVCALGLLGAWLVGGWFMLSNAYNTGLGGTTAANAGANAMSKKAHWFRSYGNYIKNAEQTVLPATVVGGGNEGTVKGGGRVRPETWALLYGAGTVTAVTVLRQFFAGFWFHPIGLLVGPTWMVQEAWGSLLLAWLVRLVVLKLGGAATVRNKLLPFATGIFLGGTASYLLYVVIVSYLKFFVPGTKNVWWSIWAL